MSYVNLFPNGAPAGVRDDVESVEDETEKRFDPTFDDDCLPGLFNLKDIKRHEPPPRLFTLPNYIPEREVTYFTGEGGVGKSLFAQQFATALALGKPFLGMDLSQGEFGTTLYVTCEEGSDEIHRRQAELLRDVSDGEFEKLREGLFIFSLRGQLENELAVFDDEGKIQPTQAYRRLSATIRQCGAEIVILDNVGHLFGGDENNRRQVTAFINLLYKMVKANSCTVLLIGHPNKSGDSYSGSTAWLNAVRSQLFLRYVEDENGDVADPDKRVLINPKSNYARRGVQTYFRWHDHQFVIEADLPNDTRQELAEAQRVASENQIFLQCLRVRHEQGRDVGPHVSANYAPTQFARMTEAKGLKKPAFERAMERLFHIGAIEVCEVKREGKGGTKTIIAETPERSPERFPNAIPNAPELCDRTPPHTPPISKDIRGAAPKPPAPHSDEMEAAQ